MMRNVIFGNGMSAISQKISSIKRAFDPLSIIEFDGDVTAWETAIATISTPQLFSESRLVILENFEEDLDFEKLPLDINLSIIIKISKNLNANSKVLKSAAKFKFTTVNLSEKEETQIFPFLDGLVGQNQKVLSQIPRIIADYGSQYLLTMIFYSLRRLVLPGQKLPDFVAKKINEQRRNFDDQSIRRIYKSALLTDFKIKNGLIDDLIGLTLLSEAIVNTPQA